jgi:hypothetical protein
MDTVVGMSRIAGVEEYNDDSPCSGPAPVQFALCLLFWLDGNPGFVSNVAQPPDSTVVSCVRPSYQWTVLAN